MRTGSPVAMRAQLSTSTARVCRLLVQCRMHWRSQSLSGAPHAAATASLHPCDRRMADRRRPPDTSHYVWWLVGCPAVVGGENLATEAEGPARRIFLEVLSRSRVRFRRLPCGSTARHDLTASPATGSALCTVAGEMRWTMAKCDGRRGGAPGPRTSTWPSRFGK